MTGGQEGRMMSGSELHGRVWLLTEDYPPKLGGLSRWASNTARAMASAGIDVTVFAKRAGSADGTGRPLIVSVEGRDFPRFGRFHFARAMRPEAARSGLPDLVIHSTWHIAGVDTGHFPSVTCVHGKEVFERPGFFASLQRKRILERSTAVAAASSFTAGRVREIAPGARLVVGINGVDTALFTPEGPVLPRRYGLELVSAGRLVGRKRFDLVIAVLRKLIDLGMDAGLRIAGTGPLEPDLRGEAAGLGDRVSFEGEVTDERLASLYRSADLFLSPCRSDPASGDVEGFGLTFIEASACGTAVAGLAEGGVTDAVEHGVSGILSSPGSFVDDVAGLCANRRLLEGMGAAGRRRAVESFEVGAVVRRLLDSVPGPWNAQ